MTPDARPFAGCDGCPHMQSVHGERTDMNTVLHEELSHGLRTPLTSVLGYAATLLDRWDDLEEADRVEFIRVVYGEALRMAQSIEEVDRELYREFAGRNARSGAFKPLHGLADAS
jgi:signal transduction histidine kinase